MASKPIQTKEQRIAEFGAKQAALGEEWLRLNHLAVEAEQREVLARKMANSARHAADNAYRALHDHVFGTNYGEYNEV